MNIDPVVLQAVALSLGAAWASGINLYAATAMLGGLQLFGQVNLPSEMQILAHPVVLLASGFMYCVEFFADKVPGVDSGWDAIHTFIRIPAGAVLAYAAVGDVAPEWQVAAALVGGGVTASTHVTKASTRALINTSPEPFTNWGASVTEDVAVVGMIWAVVYHPLYSLIALVVTLLLLVWMLPKLWRAVGMVFGRVKRLVSGKGPEPVFSVRTKRDFQAVPLQVGEEER